jgi:hypothetical protein
MNDLLFWLPRCAKCTRRVRVFHLGMCFDCCMDEQEALMWERLIEAIDRAREVLSRMAVLCK